MEILREGKVKTYIFECSECGCVFVANSSEVEYYHTVALITSPYMHCPHCLTKEVSGDEVTEEELEEIKERLKEMDKSAVGVNPDGSINMDSDYADYVRG